MALANYNKQQSGFAIITFPYQKLKPFYLNSVCKPGIKGHSL